MGIISNTKNEKNQVVLEIEVAKDVFAPAVKKAIEKQVKKMTVPGFRKGKAPANIVVKYCGGEAAFYEDAVNDLYPSEYSNAITEAGIEPVDRADVEIISVDENGFKFKAIVTVKPDVTLGKYKGLKAEKKILPVSKERVDSEIEKLRNQVARQISVTDRPAKIGDTVNIDYEGFIGDAPFAGGKAEKQDLSLGSGSFIPGFEEKVVGHSAGDEFEIGVKFPEEYHSDEVAGKDATFKIKLHEIKFTELPKVDDEFAKDVSEFDTIKDLKADLEAKIKDANDKIAENELEETLIDLIVADMKTDLPEPMIESSLDGIVQDFEYRLSSQGMDLKTYLSLTGMEMDGFRKNFRDQAEKKAKIRLALEEIAKLEKIEVGEKELEEEFEKIASAYQMKLEDVKKYIPVYDLKRDLAVGKAVEIVKSSAKVTEVEAKPEEAPKKPAAKKPAEKTADKKPAEKKETAKKPAAKTAAAGAKKETAPKAAAEKKPAAKKPAAKKTDK